MRLRCPSLCETTETIDAISAQTEFAAAPIEGSVSYLSAVKGNPHHTNTP